MRRFAYIFLLLLSLEACSFPGNLTRQTPTQPPGGWPQEEKVRYLPMQGPAAQKNAELSGLAWYHDTLILLPQYPNRMGTGGKGALFGLKRQEIIDNLDGNISGKLSPFLIPVETGDLERKVPGYNGFEAIAFSDERIFLTIEALEGIKTHAYMVAGEIHPDLSLVRLDPESLTEIPLPLDLYNMGDEAMIITGNSILTFYEANGKEINPYPLARRFDLALHPLQPIPFPNLPYRVTDATPPDENGLFWVINYNYPGDKPLQKARDPISEQWGKGFTHAQSDTVERLVELQYTPERITLAGTAPFQLMLSENDSRNWEGLAILQGRGFLLVTDTYPDTIVGFVK